MHSVAQDPPDRQVERPVKDKEEAADADRVPSRRRLRLLKTNSNRACRKSHSMQSPFR